MSYVVPCACSLVIPYTYTTVQYNTIDDCIEVEPHSARAALQFSSVQFGSVQSEAFIILDYILLVVLMLRHRLTIQAAHLLHLSV